MTIGVDTDVLVNWLMNGAPDHLAARRFLQEQVGAGEQLGLAPQVIFELVHIVSDTRRFERALPIKDALDAARTLWDAPETTRLSPAPGMLHRTLELMGSAKLGRKRILDTALAATLEGAGITRLATFNAKDFRAFPFLEIVDPRG